MKTVALAITFSEISVVFATMDSTEGTAPTLVCIGRYQYCLYIVNTIILVVASQEFHGIELLLLRKDDVLKKEII